MKPVLVALLALAVFPLAAQEVITVPLTSLSAYEAFGAGGATPDIQTGAQYGPNGEATHDFQPAAMMEWPVNCTTPGFYTVAITLAQWQDPRTVLAIETRPSGSAFVTRYAAPDTRDYGRTNGELAFMDCGELQDEDGNEITVPLWSGQNYLRIRNVTDRHNPPFDTPTATSDPRAREWGLLWSDVRIGSITLRRVGDLPPMATLSGTVLADRPAGFPVRGAIVSANPPGHAPIEPSRFWNRGWTTVTDATGSYSITLPVGAWDVKAGRPGSYQAQGSDVAGVEVAESGQRLDFTLKSAFTLDASGVPTITVPLVYFDGATGSLAILPIDIDNGYKLGWIGAGEGATVLVDAPWSGMYTVTSAYTNGGSTGTLRVSTEAGSSSQSTQSAGGWNTLRYKTYANPVYLRRGTNIVTQTLVSGESDLGSLRFTMVPVDITYATIALRCAAGLVSSGAGDITRMDLTGDRRIFVDDAVEILRLALLRK